jgi:hypothetical protein
MSGQTYHPSEDMDIIGPMTATTDRRRNRQTRQDVPSKIREAFLGLATTALADADHSVTQPPTTAHPNQPITSEIGGSASTTRQTTPH